MDESSVESNDINSCQNLFNAAFLHLVIVDFFVVIELIVHLIIDYDLKWRCSWFNGYHRRKWTQ